MLITPTEPADEQQIRGPSVVGVIAIAIALILITPLGLVAVVAGMTMFLGGAVLLLPARTRRLGAALVLGVLAGAFVWLFAITVIVDQVGS